MSKHVFVVDADAGFTDTLKGTLSDRGLKVSVLGDGKDALDRAKAEKPDLIVLCVELPKMSGYSICNKLKKDDDLKGIPLIITSSEATPETFEQHKKLKTRAEEYLIKPFSADALLDKIGALVGLPEAAGAPAEEVVASGGDELDFDSLTAGVDDPPPPPPPLEEEDPLAALGAESLDSLPAVEPEPPPPPPAAKAAPKPPPPRAPAGDDLDALLAPSPKAAAKPASTLSSSKLPATPPPAAPRPMPSSPPRSATSTTMEGVGVNAETDRQLRDARKESTDLKAKVAALETRLKQAEEATARAKEGAGDGRASASSAKDMLHLKEQLNQKDKEILNLREEVFAKEKDLVGVQEQVAQAEERAAAAEAAKAELETQVATVEARLQAAEQHLAENEQAQEARMGQLNGQMQDLQQRLADAEAAQQEVGDLRAKVEELDNSLRAAQEETTAMEDRLLKAHKKLKADEQVREKLRRALDIAQQLVSDSVVDSEESGANA